MQTRPTKPQRNHKETQLIISHDRNQQGNNAQASQKGSNIVGTIPLKLYHLIS